MVAKKSATKSMANKTTSLKKAAVTKNSKKATAVSKPYTKTEIVATLAENAELSKKQVKAVLDGLNDIIERHLKKKAPGVFVLPGLLKLQVIHKPATKARKGISPFTGEETLFKAKPARNLVKIRPLKKLKDMV